MAWEPEDDFEDEFAACEPVELRFQDIVRETDKAWLIRFPVKEDLTNDDVWAPKSICDIVREGKNKILRMPYWMVEEKNLEDYVIYED